MIDAETLVPIPETAAVVACDFPGCGKTVKRAGLGRHRATHKREEPQALGEQIIAKLRARTKNNVRNAIAALETLQDGGGMPAHEMGHVYQALNALSSIAADLELLGIA